MQRRGRRIFEACGHYWYEVPGRMLMSIHYHEPANPSAADLRDLLSRTRHVGAHYLGAAGTGLSGGLYVRLSAAPVYGPVPSLRLKALRDGMQDYELLVLAAQKDPQAMDAAIAVGCRGDANPGNAQMNCFHSWNTEPAALLNTRQRLATIIQSHFPSATRDRH